MGNIVFNQAAKFLSKRRNTRRWIAAVLCLALVVTSGTFGMLTRHGSALSDTKLLDCAFEVHQHSSECYNEAGELICGKADYCVHTHNDDCYDSEGNLVCKLPEIEAHVHDDSCFEEEECLICELEEGHQHTDECYEIELGELTCGMAEHVHDDSCYELIPEGEEIPEDENNVATEAPVETQEPVASEAPVESQEPATSEAPAQSEEPAVSETPEQSQETPATEAPAQSEEPTTETPAASEETPASEPAAQSEEPAAGEVARTAGLNRCAENRRLTCAMEEHTHSDNCYNQTKVLKCEEEESSDAHIHTEECYETNKVAKCGQLELHTHTTDCYTDGVLTCGKLELVEHVHGDECFKLPIKELAQKVGDVTIIVSAYEEGAIPDGAELSVTPIERKEITEEMNEEEKAQAEEQNAQYEGVAEKLQEKAEEEEYEIAGFLAYDICFIDAEGNKIEPTGEVKVSILYEEAVMPEEMQNLDAATFALDQGEQEVTPEEGAPEGLDVTVIHLEENEAGEVAQVVDMAEIEKVEALEVTEKQEVQKAEFLTDSFSTFVITWTIGNSKKATITVHYVDENGVEIPGSQSGKVEGDTSENATAIDLYDEYGAEIVGYRFEKITIDQVNGAQISKLKYESVSTSEGGIETTGYYIQHDAGSWNDRRWTSSSNEWTKWKTIHSNATAGDIYIVYRKTPRPPITEAEDAPKHNKYIRYNEIEKDYTLTLDVTGKKGEASGSGVDILFVIDKSGSMKDGDLMSKLQNTIESVVPTIVPEGTINKVAAVSFSSQGYSGDISTSWADYNSSDSFVSAVKGLKSEGGTNWQLDMRKAENKLEEVATDNNQKIVIFMSDGEPTHYFSKTSSTSTTEHPEWWESSPTTATCSEAAVNEVDRSTYLSKAKIYSVYLTSGTSTSMTSFATELQKKGVDATAINGTDLNNSLTALVNKIVDPIYTDVIIEDTLSEFVEFAEFEGEKPKFEVSYKEVNKTTGEITSGSVEPSKYEITYPVDGNDKKFKLTFKYDANNEKGILDPNITYSISYKVKPTKEAEDAYRNNDYNYPPTMKGDAGTDAPAITGIPGVEDVPANTTSSEQEGFYANELAVLKYKEKDESALKESEYPHPVVQVNVQRTIESYLEYDKTATVKNWDDRTYDINIVAASKVTNTTTIESGGTADIMMVFDISGSMNYKQNDNSTPSFIAVPGGNFQQINSKLDKTKVYYYTKDTHNAGSWSAETASNPMIWVEEENSWQYVEYSRRNGASWKPVPSNSGNTIYTWDSRLTTLKNAATTFVTSTAAGSPDSRVGVVTYNSSGETVNSLAKVSDNTSSLVKNINKIYAGGGTYINEGLSIAENALENSKQTDIPQYVILFADGETEEANEAIATATNLKNAGVKIYTIGFGIKSDSLNAIASPGCALTADNAEDLGLIFKTIQESITQSLEIKNATIRDMIDPRFVILDDANKPIVVGDDYTEEQLKAGVKLNYNGGTVYLDNDGNQFIVWDGSVTIPNADNGAWNQTIVVQAKTDYMGGNDVPTNIYGKEYSYISVGGYGIATLPQPKVNVKAELTVRDQNVTIFKGDEVPTEDAIIEKLFDKEGVAEEFNLNPDDFELEWYSDAACTQKIPNDINGIQGATPDEDTSYFLKVTYKTGKPSTESNANTAGNIAGNPENGEYKVAGTGIYKVNVIPGQIQISKKLDPKDVSTEDEDFQFNISKVSEDGTPDPITVTITVPAGQAEGVLNGEEALKLANLPRGIYQVVEVEDDVYGLQNLESGEDTNCQTALIKGEAITFTLGNSKQGENVITTDYTYDEASGGTLGKAVFTNEKVVGNWTIKKRSSSDVNLFLSNAKFTLTSGNTVYTGISGEDGTVKWYIPNESGDGLKEFTGKMQGGTYTLQETDSPIGYALSEERWTVVIAPNGKMTSITSSEGSIARDADDDSIYYFDNAVIYALPSTGGSGIYWYSIGGTMLMMAGALILYRNKTKRVRGCRRA